MVVKRLKNKNSRQTPTQHGSVSPPAGDADSTLLKHLESCKQDRSTGKKQPAHHLTRVCRPQVLDNLHACDIISKRNKALHRHVEEGLVTPRVGQWAKVRVDIWLNTSFQCGAEANHTFSAWWSTKGIVFHVGTWCRREHCVQFLYSHFQKRSVPKGEFG